MRKFKQKNPQNKIYKENGRLKSNCKELNSQLFTLLVCLFVSFYSKNFKTAEPIKPKCRLSGSYDF